MSGKPKTKPSANWGGKRPGSGKPKKPTAPPIERPARAPTSAMAIERPIGRADQTPQERALEGLDLAFATLEHIEMNGVTEGARVSAARIIIETAIGKPSKTASDEAAAKPADKWTDLDEARPN